MDILTVDFETYYDKAYSLSKLTTEQYVRSPVFEVILVSLKLNDGPTRWFSGTEAQLAKMFAKLPWSRLAVLAHNARFDGSILSWRFGVKPMMWLDTMSMARPFHGTNIGVSLRALAEYYNIGHKGTEVENALGKRRADFTPEQLAAYADYCVGDTDLTHKLFLKLAKRLPKSELVLIHETISLFTDPVLRLDTKLLTQHLGEVLLKKEAALLEARLAGLPAAMREAVKSGEAPENVIAVYKAMSGQEDVGLKMLRSNKQFAELLESHDVRPPMKTSPTTGKPTYAFSKSDVGLTKLLNHPNETVQALVAARLGLKSTIEETRTEMFLDLAARGPLPIPLNYSGAFQTWRWAGSEKINLQNLPRGGALRRAIVAPEGYVLVACDSSNIELRVNHTLAGQTSSVDAFINKRDLYCEFATILFGRPITSADKPERQLGKLAHLSLGYGCGWFKFMEICRLNNVILTEDRAQGIVDLWRSTYSMIPAFWRACDAALMSIYRGLRTELCGGLIHTSREGLVLPEGRFIHYNELVSDGTGQWSYRNRRVMKNIYGGAVVENICQAIARHIIADQWVAVAADLRKYLPRARVVLQVHDELVVCCPEDEAQTAKDLLLRRMSASPAWWPVVPLAAEADIAVRYGDAK